MSNIESKYSKEIAVIYGIVLKGKCNAIFW